MHHPHTVFTGFSACTGAQRCCGATPVVLTCTPPPWPIPGLSFPSINTGSVYVAYDEACCCCTGVANGALAFRSGDVMAVWTQCFRTNDQFI